MKFKNYFILILILLLVCNVGVSVLAMETGFLKEQISTQNQKLFLSNINLSLINKEEKGLINCFDVNNNGLIAIGSKNSDKKTICVYTSNGTFLYGYTFNCSSSFGVEWNRDNLTIYFVRSDVAACFDENGKCIEIKKIKDTIANNSYWNNYIFSTKRKIDQNEYILKNDMGIFNILAFSYSQLIKVNENGLETIIYDVSDTIIIKTLIIFLSVIIFISIVVSMLLKKLITKNK